MKLADEIAEEIYREQKEIRDRFGVKLGVETVKGIIAARLERVREAVKLGLRIAQEHNGEWDYVREIHILQSALTVLSEEEK